MLIAGVSAGLLVAWLGGPKRLNTQVRGIADGFFIPLYFVVLGAQLDLHALLHDPSMLALTAALAVLNVAIHRAAALVRGHSPGAGLAATAQLGVPAAVASLGLASGVFGPGPATAIVASALLSLGVSAVDVHRLTRGAGTDPSAAGAPA